MDRKKIIKGNWLTVNGKIVGDSNCKIIENMIANDLEEVSNKEDGWTILFKEKTTGKFWERTFPESDMHGGGPPQLELLSKDDIGDGYGKLF